jgi:hypothetical protein
MSRYSTKLFKTYVYCPLAHPELSAKVVRSPKGWEWLVLNADGALLKHGERITWDKAISDATVSLNYLLREQGALEVGFNPENWIGEDVRPLGLPLRRDHGPWEFSRGKRQKRYPS